MIRTSGKGDAPQDQEQTAHQQTQASPSATPVGRAGRLKPKAFWSITLLRFQEDRGDQQPDVEGEEDEGEAGAGPPQPGLERDDEGQDGAHAPPDAVFHIGTVRHAVELPAEALDIHHGANEQGRRN